MTGEDQPTVTVEELTPQAVAEALAQGGLRVDVVAPTPGAVLPWPADLTTLVMPRSPESEAGSPVLEALAMCTRPWDLAPLGHLLRDAGVVDMPTKVEAEYAAALHMMVTHALQHGERWREAMGESIEPLIAKARERAAAREAAKGRAGG